MISRLSVVAILLALPSLVSQAASGELAFRYVRGSGLSPAELRQGVEVRATAGGVLLERMFDNPCGEQPRGRYAFDSTRARLTIDLPARLTRACPAIWRPQRWQAPIPLPHGGAPERAIEAVVREGGYLLLRRELKVLVP